jgi:phosphoenolpyruvate carboxylase
LVDERRFIPKTMTTQHPDNANTPPWASSTNGVIEGETELDEAYIAYSKLACSEVMWDSEGKDVDTNVVRKLLSKYSDYFTDNVFGRDIFLTYRIPNPLVEKAERKIVTQTLQSIPLQADVASAFYEKDSVPVSAVILPFTTKGAELLWLDRCYGKAIAGIGDVSLGGSMTVKDWVGAFKPERIDAIPLVEDAGSLSSIDKIVLEYVRAVKPEVMRVFIARSDPALNYGLITAVLLSKVALGRLSKVQKKTGVRMNPILGVGTMPFRGHLNPENIDNFLLEYKGLSTVTIQSAFRYDYPTDVVERGIATLNRQLPNGELGELEAEQESLIGSAMKKLIPVFQSRVEILAPFINYVASFIPTRRARKLHIGLFGYSRRVKGVTMPRAIPFAAAFYSVGIPPEFIGAQALRSLTDKEFDAVKQTYRSIQFDYRAAGSLVSWETVHLLVDKYDIMAKITQMNKEKLKNALRYVMADLSTIEETLSLPLGPSDNRSKKHENFVNTFMMSAMDGERSSASNAFIEAAKLRRCLG